MYKNNQMFSEKYAFNLKMFDIQNNLQMIYERFTNDL